VVRILVGMFLGLARSLGGQATATGCGTLPPSTPLQPVGAFSDMRYTEEHAYGYSLELYRAATCLVGLFQASAGLAGDTPTGELVVSRYESSTGALRFTAKMTMGVTQASASKAWIPSRDLFAFTGWLGKTALRGRLRQSSELTPRVSPVEHEVVLRRSRQTEELTIKASTYGEWRRQVDAILQFRGPKW
jgi:hypothetical protein